MVTHTPKCTNCRFYVIPVKRIASRECHRAPPVFSDGFGAQWPTVEPDDWCGKHENGYTAPEDRQGYSFVAVAGFTLIVVGLAATLLTGVFVISRDQNNDAWRKRYDSLSIENEALQGDMKMEQLLNRTLTMRTEAMEKAIDKCKP